MTKNKDLVSLIKDEIDRRETALLHGTSVEAALSLLRNGSLRPDPEFVDSRDSLDSRPKDYLSFFPNPQKLRGHELYEVYKSLSWEEDIFDAALEFAQENAYSHYIVSRVGFWPRNINRIDLLSKKDAREMNDFGTYRRRVKDYRYDLKEKGFSKREALKLLEEARERKGVLIGFSKDILKLPIKKSDVIFDESVRLYAPDGLDGRCVISIVPLGSIEREELERFSIDYVKMENIDDQEAKLREAESDLRSKAFNRVFSELKNSGLSDLEMSALYYLSNNNVLTPLSEIRKNDFWQDVEYNFLKIAKRLGIKRILFTDYETVLKMYEDEEFREQMLDLYRDRVVPRAEDILYILGGTSSF